MGTVQEKKALVRLIQDNVVHIIKANSIYGGQFELDGIICISGLREGQELVVKLHERFGSNPNTPIKIPLKPDLDTEINNRHLDLYRKAGYAAAHGSLFTHNPPPFIPINDFEPEMLDLRIRPNDNRSDISKQSEAGYSSPAKRWKPDAAQGFDAKSAENEMDRSYSTNTSPSLDDQVENLSMSAANSEDGGSMSASPDKGQYLGKAPYISSPYHLQKKTPLKQERWTPSTPLPSIPECRQCGFTFESFEVLSDHNEAVHSVFTCQHCHKTFTSRSNLERHSRLHTGFKPYICAICGKAFSRKDHLSNHSAKHAFKCGNCNKRYADKQSLASHFTYEHEALLTNTCEFCNKGFSSLEACEEHVKTHPQYQAVQRAYQNKPLDLPPPSKKYSCDACRFVTHERITLIKHRLVHIDGQRCYTCLSCAKMFTDPLQYDEHMLSHEGQLNIYECCICRQIFPTMDVLQRHEVVHLNEDLNELMSAALPCPHCDKVLKNMPALQEHILQHAQSLASKKHKCLYCNMGFGSYAELCRHMDELRHYPPDPRMLFGLGMPPSFGAFDARKFADLFTNSQKNASRDLILADRLSSKPEQKSESVSTQRQPSVTESTPDDKNKEIISQNGESETEQKKDTNEKSENDLDNDIGSDIEVVEPEAPEDDVTASQVRAESFNADFEVTENKPDEVEVTDNKADKESPAIQNQPVKSMLCNKNSNNSVEAENRKEDKTEVKEDVVSPVAVNEMQSSNGIDIAAPMPNKSHTDRARKRKGPSPEKYVNDGEPMDMSMNEYYDNYDMESLASDNSNPSNNMDVFPPNHLFQNSALPNLLHRVSPLLASEAKLQMQIHSERKREVSRITPNKLSVDIPPGPCTCSICQQTLANFQALEQHCFAEHNRCPCMFCPKTFAQKANRDRHVCLHTGDKPYECPECGEKFSRGDKLKLHRVRTHNIPTHPSGYGKRESLTPSRDWVIPSPSTNQSEPENWSLPIMREDGGGLVPGGGEWMVQENLSYSAV